MTQAQLQQGDNLSKRIATLKEELEKWQKSNFPYNNDFTICLLKDGSTAAKYVISWQKIDKQKIFFVVRAMAIAELEEKISKLEKEFDSL